MGPILHGFGPCPKGRFPVFQNTVVTALPSGLESNGQDLPGLDSRVPGSLGNSSPYASRGRALVVSLAMHALFLAALFAVHLSTPTQNVFVRRTASVTLLAPVKKAPDRTQRAIVQPVLRKSEPAPALDSPLPPFSFPAPRAPSRVFEAPPKERIPLPSLPDLSLIAARPVNLRVEPVLLARTEMPRFATAPAPLLKTDSFSAAPTLATSVPAASASPAMSGGVHSAGFGASQVGVAQSSGANSRADQPAPTGTSAFTVNRGALSLEPRAQIKAGAFASAEVGPAARERVNPQGGEAKPLQILIKPRPDYTDEARRQQIEGEVLLELLFPASGETRVVRLVRGLGHGLDESAMAAARAIRFRPAEQAGVPVDTTAVVHIVFQLAY